MRIVIIEDELPIAEDLEDTIRRVEPNAEIIKTLHSVKEAIEFMQINKEASLIFSDINLGDGLSFEIFKQVELSIPVIFCTAYNEYALEAFKANGIDYILKPYTAKSISDALHKYKYLRNESTQSQLFYEKLASAISKQDHSQTQAILVYSKDKIIPIKLEDIALFYIEHEISYLISFTNKNFTVNKKMEELERLTGSRFFRANRQFLINRKAITDASFYFGRKLALNLCIPFHEKITISKEKSPIFLEWLSNQT